LKRAGLAVLLLVAGAVPALASDFQLFKFTGVLVYAIALLGLNILAGYNGQISLGHGAFYTLGAYVAAILMTFPELPHWIALPAAGAVCLAAGTLFALPLVKLDGIRFALVTFALAAVVPQLANYKAVEAWTGGSQGLGLDRPEVPLGLPLTYDQWIYLLALLVLVLLFWVASNLLGGRIGRAARAIRDHQMAAQAMGIHSARFKALIFGVSAMYTGLAGALSAMALLYVSPAGILVSLGFLIGSAVGGIATLSGAIYGALFLQLILLATGTIAQTVPGVAAFAVYGTVVIVFVLFLPSGVAGAVESLAARMRR
jgi:branched-chain amino acid transport system permease protein